MWYLIWLLQNSLLIFHLYVSLFFHLHFKEMIRSDYYKWRVGSCHDCFYSRRTNVLKINECRGSFDHIDTLKHISTIENLEEKERFNLGWWGSRVRIHHSSVYTNYSIHKHNYEDCFQMHRRKHNSFDFLLEDGFPTRH